MLAVGWGVQTSGAVIKNLNYYIIVKNSFGVAWGENGYGKVVVQVNKN
jgi:C1A family cysteine protease